MNVQATSGADEEMHGNDSHAQSFNASELVVAVQHGVPSGQVPSTLASTAGDILSDDTLPTTTHSSDERDRLVPTQPLPAALQVHSNIDDTHSNVDGSRAVMERHSFPSQTSSALAVAGTPGHGPDVEHDLVPPLSTQPRAFRSRPSPPPIAKSSGSQRKDSAMSVNPASRDGTPSSPSSGDEEPPPKKKRRTGEAHSSTGPKDMRILHKNPAASHGRAPPLNKDLVDSTKGKAGSSKDSGRLGSNAIPPPKKTRQGQPNMDNYV
ncbi:hypothetical protein C8Q73DRAFT_796091 [Cubamyces lactineus]|nr:hypothetical protein C8Q73DRAFT_796091 [Cubamyces lactineus]